MEQGVMGNVVHRGANVDDAKISTRHGTTGACRLIRLVWGESKTPTNTCAPYFTSLHSDLAAENFQDFLSKTQRSWEGRNSLTIQWHIRREGPPTPAAPWLKELVVTCLSSGLDVKLIFKRTRDRFLKGARCSLCDKLRRCLLTYKI